MSTFVIVVFLSVLTRFPIIKRDALHYDAFGHLYFSKELRRQKSGPFGSIKRKFVGSGQWSSPFLWHWLVGFFPLGKVVHYQNFINTFIDSVFAVIIYGVSLAYFGDQLIAFYIVAMYLFTPMWFSSISMGPRLEGFTPRLSSEIVTNLFFIVTLLPLGLPAWAVVFLGAFLAAFVVFSSRFGLQAVLFITPITSLLAWNAMPLIALIFGMIFSTLLSRGRCCRAVKEQLNHLTWYFRKNLQGGTLVSNRNSFKAIIEPLKENISWKTSLPKSVVLALARNSFTGVIIKMPILLLFPFVFYFNNSFEVNMNIVAPILSSIIVFFVVNTKKFLFLGEAERYLNHVAFFISAAVVHSFLMNDFDTPIIIVLIYGCFYWLVEVFFYRRYYTEKKQLIFKEQTEIIKLLQQYEDKIILCYPYHAVGVWRILLETSNYVLRAMTGNKSFDKVFEDKYEADYPYVNIDRLDEMAKEYNLDFLIASKEELSLRGYDGWTPSSSWEKINQGFHLYYVYKRKPLVTA